VIVVFRRGQRAFFVHGFAKSDRENLRRKELGALRALADEMLGWMTPAWKRCWRMGRLAR